MSRLRRLAALCLALLVASTLGCSKEVTVGALISETGAVGPYGHSARRGIELALEEINAAGGFKGAPIEMVFEDDATNVEAGKLAITRMIQELGIKVIIGAISSQVTLAIAPICEKNRVVLLSPSASAVQVTDAGDYIFRNYPSDVLEGTAMADFARDIGLERVVIIANPTEFGQGLRDIFTSGFESRVRKVVKTFDSTDEDAEIVALIAEVEKLKPDGIYIVAYQDQQVKMMRAMHEAGIRAVVLSSAGVTEQLIKGAGPAAQYMIYPQPHFDLGSNNPAVASFVTAYRAKYDEDPDIFAAHGYDALKLILAAMERTQSAHPDDIKLGLLGLEAYRGATGETSFDGRGDVVRYPRLFVVKDGKSIGYRTFTEQGGKLPMPRR